MATLASLGVAAQNTGIGTTSPKAKLDVANSVRIDREANTVLGIGIKEYNTPWARGYNFTDENATKNYGGFYGYGDGSNTQAGVRMFGIGAVNQLDANSVNYDAIAKFFPADKLTWLNGGLRVGLLPAAADTDDLILANATGDLTKASAATVLNRNTEWYYNSTANQIKLRRSGQPSGFVNTVYYNNANGAYTNYDATSYESIQSGTTVTRALDPNSAKNYFISNSQNIPTQQSVVGGTTYNGKRLITADLIGNESAAITNLDLTATGGNVYTATTHKSPTRYLTGSTGSVFKNDPNATSYITSGNFTGQIFSGSISGYMNGIRSEVFANTSGSIPHMSSINNFTTVGTNQTGNIGSVIGVSGGIQFVNNNATSVQEVAGLNYTTAFYPGANPTISNMYGLKYSGLSKSSGALGTIGNHYGIMVGDINGATNNFALYTGTGKNSLGDVLQLRTINDAANVSTNTNDKILVADAQGNVKTAQSAASISSAAEPWFNSATTAAATSNSQNIYQTGNVAVGSSSGQNTGTLTILANQGTPVSNRITYGTDNTGYKFAIAKNNAGTITDQVIIQDNGNVGIATSSPTEKLEVAGNVKAAKFIAGTAIFPDYVFQNYYTGTASNLNPAYKFPSLKETEKFIKENGHLPGFQKAEEIVKAGAYDVSATALMSLEKIEELYLHMIELEKRVKTLEAENAQLKAQK